MGKDMDDYVYKKPGEPPNKGIHFHHCRGCGEDWECEIDDDCYLASLTFCVKCYEKAEKGEL